MTAWSPSAHLASCAMRFLGSVMRALAICATLSSGHGITTTSAPSGRAVLPAFKHAGWYTTPPSAPRLASRTQVMKSTCHPRGIHHRGQEANRPRGGAKSPSWRVKSRNPEIALVEGETALAEGRSEGRVDARA
eukprot:899994-Prorocentrum_minimum.AAC.1